MDVSMSSIVLDDDSVLPRRYFATGLPGSVIVIRGWLVFWCSSLSLLRTKMLPVVSRILPSRSRFLGRIIAAWREASERTSESGRSQSRKPAPSTELYPDERIGFVSLLL
ncbi:hypothetical protein BDW66DRAFT_133031 [Aspergillus desertorum]